MFRIGLSSVLRSVASAPAMKSCFQASSIKVPTAGVPSLFTRLFHNTTAAFSALKTKQSAAKRLLRTSKGGIKFGHACKSHLNGSKSRKQIRRLNGKGRLEGVWEKKMNKLLLG